MRSVARVSTTAIRLMSVAWSIARPEQIDPQPKRIVLIKKNYGENEMSTRPAQWDAATTGRARPACRAACAHAGSVGEMEKRDPPDDAAESRKRALKNAHHDHRRRDRCRPDRASPRD